MNVLDHCPVSTSRRRFLIRPGAPLTVFYDTATDLLLRLHLSAYFFRTFIATHIGPTLTPARVMGDSSTSFSNEISFKYVSPGEMIAASTVLPALSIIFVALRFYVRKLQRAQIGIDDWLIVPGLVQYHLMFWRYLL